MYFRGFGGKYDFMGLAENTFLRFGREKCIFAVLKGKVYFCGFGGKNVFDEKSFFFTILTGKFFFS